MPEAESYMLNLAGEYRVCSELIKRGLFATITYGNRKAVDVYAIPDRSKKALRIEVKTTQQGKFVTRITQKGLAKSPDAPDFRVLFQVKHVGEESVRERFFILTHREICRIQKRGNDRYKEQYEKRHKKQCDPMKGVDNVNVKDVKKHENAWRKIMNA